MCELGDYLRGQKFFKKIWAMMEFELETYQDIDLWSCLELKEIEM